MSIRMKDIAKDLGVSMITISKVLRNHPDIGDETRERVLARVKEREVETQSILQSIEALSCAYLRGLGRSLAVTQVVEGTE
jgi:LacI family transcriptional regulator